MKAAGRERFVLINSITIIITIISATVRRISNFERPAAAGSTT